MKPVQVRYDENGRVIDANRLRTQTLAHIVSGTGLPSPFEMRVRRMKDATRALEQALNTGDIGLINSARETALAEQKKWALVPNTPPFVRDLNKVLEQANRMAPRQNMAPRNNM